ncbi:MAG: response regulator [Alphaproteobacteria bacterium]
MVLMDVQMPELDGLEATRLIRALAGEIADVPIIGMTAHAFAEDHEACLQAGMDDYISKPISRKLLLEKVRHWASVSAKRSNKQTTTPIVETNR